MERAAANRVIDMTAYFEQTRRDRHQDQMHKVLALWTQYLSIAALVVYGLLRLVLCAGTPVGTYSGPLVVLWPVALVLLAVSYFADILLWREQE